MDKPGIAARAGYAVVNKVIAPALKVIFWPMRFIVPPDIRDDG